MSELVLALMLAAAANPELNLDQSNAYTVPA